MNQMTTPDAPGGEGDGGDPEDPMALMRELLVEHAVSLDGIFADLTDYAARTFRESPFAAQAYLRLALRAQSSCRSSLEAVVRADRARSGGHPALGGDPVSAVAVGAGAAAGDPAPEAAVARAGRAARAARRSTAR